MCSSDLVFEMDKFSKGSIKMSHAIIDTHATTVVGGGDTADVVERAGDADEMTFISVFSLVPTQYLLLPSDLTEPTPNSA